MVATRKGKTVFSRDVGPARLPVLSSVPHPVHGTTHMYKQAALNDSMGIFKERAHVVGRKNGKNWSGTNEEWI